MTACRRTRRGFALLAVLWTMVAVTALVMAISLAGREAQEATRNRVALARASWIAEGCAERVRAEVGRVLARDDRATLDWRHLDRVVLDGAMLDGCDVTLRAAGARVDVNVADGEQLRALALAMGASEPAADSLADAILDWRDADTIPRPMGAEREWYLRQGLPAPRDGPLVSGRELQRVRGAAAIAGLEGVLDVEEGRVLLDHAEPTVLASLPGVGAEVLARVAERRGSGVPVQGLASLAGELSPEARQALLARQLDLARLTALEPEVWILTSVGTSGSPRVTSTLELRLARAGTRAAILRRRSWP